MAWAAASLGTTICEFSEDPGEAVNWFRLSFHSIISAETKFGFDLDNKT